MKKIERVCGVFVLMLGFLLGGTSVVVGDNLSSVPSLYQWLNTDYRSSFDVHEMIIINDVNPSLGEYYSLNCYGGGTKIYFPPGATSLTIYTRLSGLVGSSCGYEDYSGQWVVEPYVMEAYADPDCSGANVVFTGSRTYSFADSTSRFTLYANNPQATQGNWVYIKFLECSRSWNCPTSVEISHGYNYVDLDIFKAWWDNDANFQANGDPVTSCSRTGISTPSDNEEPTTPVPPSSSITSATSTLTANLSTHSITVQTGDMVNFAAGIYPYQTVDHHTWSCYNNDSPTQNLLSSETTSNPAYKFSTSGIYTVSVQACDASNQCASASNAVSITVNDAVDEPQPPLDDGVTVTLSADKTEGSASLSDPLSVKITAMVDGLESTEGYQYIWTRSDNGNNFTTESNSIEFEFDKAGEYSVKVGVHDPEISLFVTPAYESEKLAITVTEALSTPPSNTVTLWTEDATTGVAPMSVTVNAEVAVDFYNIEDDDFLYAWYVDGKYSDSYHPMDEDYPNEQEFSFDTPGVYSITLGVGNISDQTGFIYSEALEVTVSGDAVSQYEDGYKAGGAYCRANPGVCGIQGAILDIEQLHFFIPRFESDHPETLFSGYKNFSFIKMGSDDIKNEIALQQFSSEEDATMIWMLTDYGLVDGATEDGVGEYLRGDESLQYMEGFYDAMMECEDNPAAFDLAEAEMRLDDGFTVSRFVKSNGENAVPLLKNFQFKRLTLNELIFYSFTNAVSLLWKMDQFEIDD